MTAPRPAEAAPLAARIAAGLRGAGDEPALFAPHGALPLSGLAGHEMVEAPPAALAGRSLLVRTRDPLLAAAALAALDGRAARLVLCPPDVKGAALARAAEHAGVEALVTDTSYDALPGLPAWLVRSGGGGARTASPEPPVATEWALFTSGTTGGPKLAVHTLAGLTGALPTRTAPAPRESWATFYDPRRYGGLQMLLRALLGGFSLHLGAPEEPMASFLRRIAEAGVSHVAGTPSHWRRALMAGEVDQLQPRYLRLSGEIADQAVLDALAARFPDARIGHAYASTEAGVGFEVTDGLAGFPAAWLEREDAPVRMRMVDGVLQLRSPRAALRYLGPDMPAVRDADGWVDTGDEVERRGDRLHFLGRRSGIVNVGGLKVAPEEVEAVINATPGVRMSRVAARASPILGALVSAEMVGKPGCDPDRLCEAVAERCRAALPPHKRPATLRLVEALPLGPAGKLERSARA